MLAILKDRQLLTYLVGNFISIVGTWAQRVVVFWVAWELTQSTAFLGTLALLDLLPSVLTAPIAGALVGRHSGRELARNVQFLSALPPLAMIVVTQFEAISPANLMLITLASGVLSGLDHPLRLLLVGSIVPRERVAGAVAANSVAFNIGRMLGPALGGWIVYMQAPALVFGYNSISFLIFAAVLATLAIPGENRGEHFAGGETARAGWSDVARAFDRDLLLICAQFAALAGLIRPVFELLPGFSDGLASERFDAAQVFSLLTSAQGFGAILGALAASRFMPRTKVKIFGPVTGIAAALSTLAFLAVGQFAWGLVFLAVIAGAILANGIATQVALQTSLPANVRGKALSLYTMVMRGMPAAGALVIGAIGEFIPLRTFSAALATIMLLFLAWSLARARH